MNSQPNQKPHALYVAWGFPPSRGGGVYRALATANGLFDAGFDVTVLTCEREAFERFTGVDPSLEAEVRAGIEIIRLPFDWPSKETDIRRWPESRARDLIAWAERRIVEERRDFPESGYGHWASDLQRAADEIHRRRPVDLVIGTANPNVDLVPALHLHRQFGVPFVYDHRDAWTLHLYTEEETNLDDPRVAATERELVEAAAEVWFVNDPISDWHRARYREHAEKILTVPNGFDREFVPQPEAGRVRPDRPVTFGYIGTITPYMPMPELVSAWSRAAELEPAMVDARAAFYGYLGFYGTPNAQLTALFEASAAVGIDYRGPVAKTAVREVYGEFDVLLLVLGTGRFITSGKVYEYMATGLPIVSVHDPSLDSSRVLANYPNWFPAASLDREDIAAALAAAARSVRMETLAAAEACAVHAEQFERQRILSPRLQHLHAMVTTGGVG